jgi:hypothetical protein
MMVSNFGYEYTGILYFITLIIISSKILNIFKNIFEYLGMV